jgi:hypothetical protein
MSREDREGNEDRKNFDPDFTDLHRLKIIRENPRQTTLANFAALAR